MSLFSDLAVQTDSFWERVAERYRVETREFRARELEEARWGDDGGGGSKVIHPTYRDQALGMVRELGRRYSN